MQSSQNGLTNINIGIPSTAEVRNKSYSLAAPNSIEVPNPYKSSNSRWSTSMSRQSWSRPTAINNSITQSNGQVPKSFDSRVLIDISLPNFKTQESEQHDIIINSLRNNYINSRRFSNSTNGTSQLNNNSFPSLDIVCNDDPFDQNLVNEGGDITRDIYRLAAGNSSNGNLNSLNHKSRTKSMEDINLMHELSRKQSTASGLNVPGGFRREHIVQKLRQEQNTRDRTYGSITRPIVRTADSSSAVTSAISESETVPFITRNFLEFLYIYGHFAGESFEDDFISEATHTSKRTADETATLFPGRNMLYSSESAINGPMIQSMKGKIPTMKAFLLLLKSFIGTGVLFLPSAFSNGGLLFSISMLAFFGIYSYWCYYILIQSKEITGVTSFGDIGLKLYGKWMKFIILLSLVLSQVGFSGAYIIFTAKNLKAFIANVFNILDISLAYLMVLQLVIFIPLSFVRNVSKLSLTSLLANFFIMSGLVIVLFFTVKHLFFDLDMKPEAGVIIGFNPNHWTVFVGTAIFAFEGIGLIIPVQDSMRHPEHFPLVLGLVILTATILFISVGTIGYLAYGKYVETVILLNLPQSNFFVNLIQLFYSIAIMLSTPLQLFPAIKIIENKVFPKFTKSTIMKDYQRSDVQLRPNSGKLDWRVKWRKNVLRSIIVSLIILMAYHGYDDLDKFVSVIGSFACIPLVYMYPPMLHLQSYSIPNSKNKRIKWHVFLDYTLIVFGGISMVYTSYQSIFGN